jgi:hypothetical protein
VTCVELPDGRRVCATYDRSRDWWIAYVDGVDTPPAEGHWLRRVLSDAVGAPTDATPSWFLDALHELAGSHTPSGWRFPCRCCGFLTLGSLDSYEICPVCDWEDDPTTIFEPGERGGPGPNHVSLTEGRRNFAEAGIAKPWLRDRVTLRDPFPGERP